MIVTIEVDDNIYATFGSILSEGDTVEDFLPRFMKLIVCGLLPNPGLCEGVAGLAWQVPGVDVCINMLRRREEQDERHD